MTDKEMVFHLCKKLNLKLHHESLAESYMVPHDGYYDDKDKNQVSIGSGAGYSGFYVLFNFDDGGNIIKHSVFE